MLLRKCKTQGFQRYIGVCVCECTPARVRWCMRPCVI